MAPGRGANAKPAVHRLHAEVPCNYILGRLAAALQNVFAFTPRPPPFFLIKFYLFPIFQIHNYSLFFSFFII